MGTQHNINLHRKITATIAMLLVISLSITVTFAWYVFSKRELNHVDVTANSGGRIHDDFYNQDIVATRSNHANKDVYAENFGENNLIVRIKLSEYLEIDGKAVTGEQRDDKSTWSPYVLENEEEARKYVTWTMGGSKIFLPTFNLDQNDRSTDAKGDAIDVITGVATGIGDGTADYFAPAGTHFEEDGTKLENPSATSHTSKSTLIEDRNVMSMQEWLALGETKKVGNFWVIDVDGWAYWANFLEPEQATSLLLNELIIQSGGIAENMYYAIDVIGEFATENDVDNFYNGESEHGDASSNAQDLIDTIIRGVPLVPEKEGEVFADDNGTLWRVLVSDDGNGNSLIITEYVVNQGVHYNLINAWTPFEESNLRNDPILGMDAWYASQAGNNIKEIALNYDYPAKALPGGGEHNGSGAWDPNVNLEIARTIAGGETTIGDGQVFPLSLSEFNHYSSTDALNEIAFVDADSDAARWWLRSPTYSKRATLINLTGDVNHTPANNTWHLRGFRAALWVRDNKS